MSSLFKAFKKSTTSVTKSNSVEKETRDDNAVAGHQLDELGRKRLIIESEKVYKLFDMADARGKREYEFYELLKTSQQYSALLGSVVPNYFGSEQRTESPEVPMGDYLVMENVYKDIGSNVCIADVKIGDVISPTERKEKNVINNIVGEIYKSVTAPGQKSYGFQYQGLKVYEDRKWVKHGKHYGWGSAIADIFTENQSTESFLSSCPTPEFKEKTVQLLIQELSKFESWLLTQRKFQFRGSSLVLAYVPPTEEQPEIEPQAIVKLVDFNNWVDAEDQRIDLDSLYGVANLKSSLLETLF